MSSSTMYVQATKSEKLRITEQITLEFSVASEDINSLRNAYIKNKESLLNRILLPINGANDEKLRHLVRIMPTWGNFPWQPLAEKESNFDHPNKSEARWRIYYKFIRAIIKSTSYLIYKYFQYFPYKRHPKQIMSTEVESAWLSPSTNLKEFFSEKHTGFWGKIKWLESVAIRNSVWVFVPYKNHGTSHFATSRLIRKINLETNFAVIPLAQFFNFRVLLSSIRENYILQKHLFRNLIIVYPKTEIDIRRISEVMGVPISRSVLNDNLLRFFFASSFTLRRCIFLLEGQPWELSTLKYAHAVKCKTFGNLHVPLRALDTQILNHVIGTNVRDYSIDQILCSDVNSYDDLKELVGEKACVRIVEAQRFIEPNISTMQVLTHDAASRNVLYIADADIDRTRTFSKLPRKLLDLNLNFYFRPHPSNMYAPEEGFVEASNLEPQEFLLVVFGRDTSAYLLPQFQESNVAVFAPDMPTYAGSKLPVIRNADDLISAINHVPSGKSSSWLTINRDQSLKKWSAVLNEV